MPDIRKILGLKKGDSLVRNNLNEKKVEKRFNKLRKREDFIKKRVLKLSYKKYDNVRIRA